MRLNVIQSLQSILLRVFLKIRIKWKRGWQNAAIPPVRLRCWGYNKSGAKCCQNEVIQVMKRNGFCVTKKFGILNLNQI